MVRARAAVAVAVLVTVAALTACRDSNDPPVPSATVPTAAPTTTTTNPYAVPQVIDAAYVDRVLARLDALKGDITRQVISSKTIPRDAVDRLRAMYAFDNGVDRELDGYSKDISRNFAGYRENPGNKKSTVREVITALATCTYVRVERDYSSVGAGSPSGVTEWIALKPLERTRDPNGYNETGWAYIYEGFTAQRAQPAQNPCNA